MVIELIHISPGDNGSFQWKVMISTPEQAAPATRGRSSAGHPGKDSQHRTTVWKQFSYIR